MVISTWVMADDGLLRRDPVVRGIDRVTGVPYFICFDEREPPELVLGIDRRLMTDEAVGEIASRIVDGLGIECIVGTDVMRSVRCFGSDPANSPYLRAASVWLDILQPIPASLLKGKGQRQPRGGDCVVYSFGKLWG